MSNSQASDLASLPQKWSEEMHSIARQPILDPGGVVYGYELLFHADAETDGNEILASRAVLDNIVLFGVERLTGGLPAFVRCTAEALTERWVSVLPPDQTVLEIPECLEVTPELEAACRELKEAGFWLALVDCTGTAEPHPLLELLEYIKTDFSRLDVAARQRMRQMVKGSSISLVAEKIDTTEEYQIAQEEGFTFFQGFYFCHPELLHGTRIPANRMLQLDMLRHLQKEPLDLKKIGPVVLRDAALVYRLLRLVNSPMCAVRQEVTSIESAIMLLGEKTFRRIANLAILGEMNNGQPDELLHMALVRARFCELSAPHKGLDPAEQYMLGMFSLLPAMLRHTMETLAPELPLRAEIREALLGKDTDERALLSWIESHEKNDVPVCCALAKAHELNQQRLTQFYVDAVVWDATAPRRFS
jgi:EAL and modified HD-GYP domain-containing signal transduction protein